MSQISLFSLSISIDLSTSFKISRKLLWIHHIGFISKMKKWTKLTFFLLLSNTMIQFLFFPYPQFLLHFLLLKNYHLMLVLMFAMYFKGEKISKFCDLVLYLRQMSNCNHHHQAIVLVLTIKACYTDLNHQLNFMKAISCSHLCSSKTYWASLQINLQYIYFLILVDQK